MGYPYSYGYTTVHSYGKRSAEPEAESKADPGYLYGGYRYGYPAYGYGYGRAYGYYGYPRYAYYG